MNLSFTEPNAVASPMRDMLNKVPEVALGFWVIKILATTVGETVADYLAVGAGFGTTVTNLAQIALAVRAPLGQCQSERTTFCPAWHGQSIDGAAWQSGIVWDRAPVGWLLAGIEVAMLIELTCKARAKGV